ncbi:thioesterase family protein [Ceratobasidium sp. AG-Ba]|nr:thioesterase family protein [Ceratobasidium sp. AG-Ba]
MAEFTEDSAGEHELITASLELEQLDAKLFRSKSLWTPVRARGVFGGQVISQALLAATRCVEEGFAVHHRQCYFLLSADASIPILYYVEHIRDGKLVFSAPVMKAAQNGRWIFMLTCSFQRPEHGQPSHSWPMPRHVPVPDDCPFQEEGFMKQSERPGISDDTRQMFLQYVQERKRSPIAIKPASTVTTTDGLVQNMFWMRAKNIPKFDSAFQKCILAYLSDLNFIGTAARSLKLHSGGEPPHRLGMISSLDHSIWFYDHDFDCAEWLLYVMISPRTGMGRGVVHGRLYTQQGNLIAVLTQEGVVRADLGERSKNSVKPKL